MFDQSLLKFQVGATPPLQPVKEKEDHDCHSAESTSGFLLKIIEYRVCIEYLYERLLKFQAGATHPLRLA